MANIRGKHNRRNRVAILATLLIITLVIGGYFLFRHGHSKAISVNAPKTIATIPSSNKGAGATTRPSAPSTQPSTPPPATESPKAGGLSTGNPSTLTAPSGNFVSDHNPSSTNFQEQSVCNTASGATCYIQFTNGSTVNQLSPETTDVNGSAFWTWDIRSADLTAGSWTITAVASLNGQTKTTSDSLPLVVPQ